MVSCKLQQILLVALVILLFGGLCLPSYSALLSDYRIDVDDRAESEYDLPDGYVITGFGFGQRFPDDVTTLRIRMQPLMAGGELGQAMVMRAGDEPEYNLLADIDLPKGWVAVGIGASPHTLAVWAAPVKSDGSLGEVKEFRTGAQPEGEVNVKFVAPANRVLTGIGLRRSGDDMAAIRARTARMPAASKPAKRGTSNTEGIQLVDHRTEIDTRAEARWQLANLPGGVAREGWVITGLGARASGDDIDAVMMRARYLQPNGQLDWTVRVIEGRGGHNNMEAEVMLPDGWVAVGVAASGQPEGDVKSLTVYGSPIMPDGKLGIVRLFSAGFQPDTRDRHEDVMLEGNRVMTGFGLRMAGHAMNGIFVHSAEIVGTPK